MFDTIEQKPDKKLLLAILALTLLEMSEKDGVKVAELEMEFAEMDGYMAESSASELLLGLDIPEDQHYGLTIVHHH
jgi:ATPase subunit of ABC transporter with duplicated ATPase domains